jgi:predicted ATPase
LGAAEIKGVEEPLQVYEVLGAGPLRTRLQVTATRRGLTRFVGRQTELEQLRNMLDQAKSGHGQIVGVVGEPGLGKSRLFYEFKLLSQAGFLILEADSVSHGKASPYLPVIELLKSYFDIQVADDERKRREKVTGKVLTLDRSLGDTLPYLFALLSIEDQPSPLQQMDPQVRRRRTFEALKKLFLRESLNQPLILIFEDLHWIDSETQGLLDTLSEGIGFAKILLLVNYRPEYRHEWGQKTYYTQVRLTPFGKVEAEEFLDELLGVAVGVQHAAPLQQLKQLILEKTEGTPFFMEEVVQTLAEEGVLSGERGQYRLEQSPRELHISPTVQGVLAARIDRLTPDEKALLQQLAVIGRQFPLSLLRHVIPHPEEELYRLLASLQHKEFLYEQPAFPEVEYSFKHALTREVAYGTVLQERRKALHERTASAIEALYRATLDERYSDLAHHYSRSGNTEKAVEYLYLAGKQAAQRSANADAIGYLTTALELLNTLPDTPERPEQEFLLQITLGPALMVTKGYAALEVEQAYTRARELCQQGGETSQLSPALWGLWIFFLIRGELRTAYELAEQLFTVAQSVQDPELLLEAHRGLGGTSFWLGELAAARAHLEQGITLYDFQRHHSHAFLYAQDPGMVCLSYLARALWYLGYPDQALQRGGEALSLAQQLSHPHSLAFALYFGAELHQYRREERRAQGQAEAVISLSTEQEFPIWLALGTGLRGWALAAQGQREEGIQQIQQSLTASQATGMGLYRPYSLALLAEVYGKTGQVEEGLTALVEALEVVDRTGERVYEAELYRLKGQLTLQSQVQGPKSKVEEAAEECFLRAIEIARCQQAKSLELRAVTSLACLWQHQGKTTEAHQTLSNIYNWFTEGFDTADLQEAKALLEGLEPR